ncbi:MAG: 50S ribosomal protein L29 [Ilumatobacteraceae bacterium]
MARELAELREMSLPDLVEELRATKQAALDLRFKHATGQLDSTSELGKTRRQIARISMLIREREIAAAEAAGK